MMKLTKSRERGYIDVGDECWRPNVLEDVGDSFGNFDHQHPLFFYIGVGHKY